MSYRHNNTNYKQKKIAKKFRNGAVVLSLVVFLSLGAIGIDWLVSRLGNSNTVVSREISSSVQSANVSVYRTEYFQFQAPDEWILVENESNSKKFVYVKNTGQLITQRLIVYIDRSATERESDIKTTNVLPVNVDELGNFIPLDKVSEHCDTSWPKELVRNPSRITHEEVSFVCAPSSKQYNVIVGKVGASEDIPVILKDGRQITVAIQYSDLTAYPSTGDIYNIVTSFNTL